MERCKAVRKFKGESRMGDAPRPRTWERRERGRVGSERSRERSKGEEKRGGWRE